MFPIAGYVIVCALKAAIAKQIRQYEFHVHNLQSLLSSSGLRLKLENEMKINTELEVSWSLVKEWSEVSRYDRNTEEDARDILSALNRGYSSG